MLPRDLCRRAVRIEGNRIVPAFVRARDHGWLRALLDEYAAFVGDKRSRLRERLREPLGVPAPRVKLAAAIAVLESLSRDRPSSALPPREARWLAFRAAAVEPGLRDRVLAGAASVAGVGAAELEAALFADLDGERRVTPLPSELGPARLAVETNAALVASLLFRAARVRLEVTGGARALIRQARRAGLICSVTRRGPNAFALDVSGPLAIFAHTQAYGRALSSLVPYLGSCERFALRASCALGRSRYYHELCLGDADPIGAGLEQPPLRESPIERRFLRDFRRALPDWTIVAEPSPIEIGDALFFPDFELYPTAHPEQRWLLEIAGYWTREYVEQRLRRLRDAGYERLLLCVDETKACASDGLAPHARVVLHRGRIDPHAVWAAIGAAGA